MLRPLVLATAIAGTLDIIAATLLTLFYGRAVPDMLRYVASGPFPAAIDWGAQGAALGLVVHFSLMAIMVAGYLVAATRQPSLNARPVRSGALYGVLTYIVMNLVVVPLRFGAGLPPSLRSFITQMFCHVVLVGIPIALIAARGHRGRIA